MAILNKVDYAEDKLKRALIRINEVYKVHLSWNLKENGSYHIRVIFMIDQQGVTLEYPKYKVEEMSYQDLLESLMSKIKTFYLFTLYRERP